MTATLETNVLFDLHAAGLANIPAAVSADPSLVDLARTVYHNVKAANRFLGEIPEAEWTAFIVSEHILIAAGYPGFGFCTYNED